MSKIALTPNASGTGTLTVASPNTNTDRTLTLPDATGTVLAAPVGAVTISSSAPSGSLTLDAAGSVGIGVSNPEDYRDFGPAPALVFGNTTGSSQATIVSGAASEGNLTFADGTTGNDSYRGMIRYNHSSDYMALFTAATERMRIDATGNVSITQAPGKYTVDVSGGATAIANGGTVDFANASGMLVVNNHNSGAVSVYLCGGGGTTLIGTTGTQVGTFTYVPGIVGYRWTNNFGSTATFGFFFVRTRTAA